MSKNSGSKTNKKNGSVCTFIMLRGDREGLPCNNPCRGDRCKYHNDKRKKYVDKKNKSKRKKNGQTKYAKLIRSCKTSTKIENLLQNINSRGLNVRVTVNSLIQHRSAIQNVIDSEFEVFIKLKEKINDDKKLFGKYIDKYPTQVLTRKKNGESVWEEVTYTDEQKKKMIQKISVLNEKILEYTKRSKIYKKCIGILEKRREEE